MTGRAGFALVTALVVVTLAATAAVELYREVRLNLDMATNFQDRTRAKLLALDGLEVVARFLIEDDETSDGPADGDALEELIRTVFPEGPRPEATLIDLSGRFNLNSLLSKDGQEAEEPPKILERLLEKLGADPNIAAALLDWMDPDDETRTGGAEAEQYNQLGVDYKPRNGPLLSLSELSLIKGFDKTLLYGTEGKPGLLELVAVFGDNKVNANTAPALLLESLASDFTAEMAQEVIERREEKQFENLSDLKTLSGLTDAVYRDLSSVWDVKSNWYQVLIKATYGPATYRLRVTLNRDNGKIETAEGLVD